MSIVCSLVHELDRRMFMLRKRTLHQIHKYSTNGIAVQRERDAGHRTWRCHVRLRPRRLTTPGAVAALSTPASLLPMMMVGVRAWHRRVAVDPKLDFGEAHGARARVRAAAEAIPRLQSVMQAMRKRMVSVGGHTWCRRRGT